MNFPTPVVAAIEPSLIASYELFALVRENAFVPSAAFSSRSSHRSEADDWSFFFAAASRLEAYASQFSAADFAARDWSPRVLLMLSAADFSSSDVAEPSLYF